MGHFQVQQGDVQALASRGPSGSRCRLSPRCLEKPAAYPDQGPAAARGALLLTAELGRGLTITQGLGSQLVTGIP
ncbi:hypothetical protein ACIQAE_26290, partial [Kitasatospora purpeofusca]